MLNFTFFFLITVKLIYLYNAAITPLFSVCRQKILNPQHYSDRGPWSSCRLQHPTSSRENTNSWWPSSHSSAWRLRTGGLCLFVSSLIVAEMQNKRERTKWTLLTRFTRTISRTHIFAQLLWNMNKIKNLGLLPWFSPFSDVGKNSTSCWPCAVGRQYS